MKERYLIAKDMFKDYLILIESKGIYKTLSEDLLILNSFKNLDSINILTVNNKCKIVDLKDCGENNRYYEYLIKAKLVQLLEILKEGIIQ